MILPNKYISNSESLMGISALILNVLSTDTLMVEDLWHRFNKAYVETKILKKNPSYQKFMLSLTLMYITNMVNYNSEGGIFNENIRNGN